MLFVFLSVLVSVVRTAQQAKTVRFLHVTFNTIGDSFLAGDQHGNIYVFDISRNRFFCVFLFVCLIFQDNIWGILVFTGQRGR